MIKRCGTFYFPVPRIMRQRSLAHDLRVQNFLLPMDTAPHSGPCYWDPGSDSAVYDFCLYSLNSLHSVDPVKTIHSKIFPQLINS